MPALLAAVFALALAVDAGRASGMEGSGRCPATAPSLETAASRPEGAGPGVEGAGPGVEGAGPGGEAAGPGGEAATPMAEPISPAEVFALALGEVPPMAAPSPAGVPSGVPSGMLPAASPPPEAPLARATPPWRPGMDGAGFARRIDAALAARWRQAKTPVSPLADDAEYCRRVTLDLLGTIPTEAELLAFLRASHPDKRARLVDDLLADPRYVKHWADLWYLWLLGRAPTVSKEGKAAFRRYLEEAVATDLPYDRMVQEMLGSEGDLASHPAAYFLAARKGVPTEMAGATAKLFLGLKLQCAQCHDHPFEPYKQTDFWGMTASFVRLRIKDNGKPDAMISEGGRAEAMMPPPKNLALLPGAKGTRVPPRFLDGAEPTPGLPRHVALARWVTSPENPTFMRAVVNRVWNQLHGHALVSPVDNVRPGRDEAVPGLLDALAREMGSEGASLRALTRGIALSRPYQLSSRWPHKAPAPDHDLFARGPVKPLGPEAVFEAFFTALAPTKGSRDLKRLNEAKKSYLSRFVFVFDTDEPGSADVFQGTVPQALMLLNDPVLNRSVQVAPESVMEDLLLDSPDSAALIRSLYLRVLSRPPTDLELRLMGERIAAGKRREVASDLMYALLNSAEFLYNH